MIVNWNGRDLLPDCLGSLAEQTRAPDEVVLVDNGSSDGSVEVARRLLPSVRVVELGRDLGFAAANNRGIEAATGDLVVLLNNDTWATSTFLEALVAAAERDPRIGMVAPKILSWYDPTVIDSVGGLLLEPEGIGQGRGRGETDYGQYDHVREILMPSGCAALYRRDMLDEIGLFPESFFAYCEDADLGLRGRWAGWRAVSEPEAVVLHKYSATAGAYSARKLFLVERNHYLLAARVLPLRLLLAVPARAIHRYSLFVRAALGERGRPRVGLSAPSLAAGLILGAAAGIALAPTQLGERWCIRRSRRIGDGEFIRLLQQHGVTAAEMIVRL